MNMPNFFIFGCERSGTTLFCALLSEHSEVCVLNDTFMYNVLNDLHTSRVKKAVRKTLAKVAHDSKLIALAESSQLPAIDTKVSPETVERFFSRLLERYTRRKKDNWLVEYGEKLDPVPVVAVAEKNALTMQKLLEITYFQLLPENQRHKPALGEKTPIHSFLSQWLHVNYPQAKSITLIRHPVTNVAAIFKRRNNLDESIGTYLSYYEQSDALLQQGETLLVRYEDLIDNPKTISCRCL